VTGRPPSTLGAWVTVGLLWFAGIAAAAQFAKMSVGFEAIRAWYATDAGTVSALMAATGLFGLVLGVSGAAITGRFGLRRVLLGALWAAAALSLVEVARLPVPVFYVMRLLEGVTNLLIVVAAPTLIALHAPAGRLPLAMSLWGTFYGVAFALTGLVGPRLIDVAGPEGLLLWHGASCGAIALVLARRRLEEPERDRRAWPGLVQAARWLAAQNRDAYRRLRTALPGLVFFFHASMYLGFLIFVPLIGEPRGLTELLLVTMPLVSILGTLLAGALAQSVLAPEKALLAGSVLVAGLTFSLLPALHIGGSAVPFAVLANALMLVSGLVQGSIFILPPRFATSAGEEAMAFGIIAQLGSLGSIVGPVAFASAVEGGGPPLFAALAAAGAVFIGLGGILAITRVAPSMPVAAGTSGNLDTAGGASGAAPAAAPSAYERNDPTTEWMKS